MKLTNSYGKFNNNEKKNKGNKLLILSEIKRAEILKAVIKDNSYSFLLDSVFLISSGKLVLQDRRNNIFNIEILAIQCKSLLSIFHELGERKVNK